MSTRPFLLDVRLVLLVVGMWCLVLVYPSMAMPQEPSPPLGEGYMAVRAPQGVLSVPAVLYEDTFLGGVVTGGFSVGAFSNGMGNFTVNIPAGSTIRQAYLVGGRAGNAADVTVTLNGNPFTFNSSNIFTTGFNTLYGGNSAVHAIDVTAFIDPTTTNYTLNVPAQWTVSDRYPEFYLYIAFNNNTLPPVHAILYANTGDLNVATQPWTLNTAIPINNSEPVGFALFGGYIAAESDRHRVNVNGTELGLIGGTDFNGLGMWGVMAGFAYYDYTLTGYGDDNANQAMAGVDALSDIQAVIPASSSTIPVTFTHIGSGIDNHIWAIALTYAPEMICGIANGQTYPLGTTAIHVQVVDKGPMDCLVGVFTAENHPNATTGIQTGGYWRLWGLNNSFDVVSSGFNVNLTAPYGTADPTTRLCKWLEGVGPGDGWDCGALDGTGTAHLPNTSVTRLGVTSFSDWAVGDEVGPTAVSYLSSTTQTNTPNPNPLIPLLATLFTLLSGVLLWLRRRTN